MNTTTTAATFPPAVDCEPGVCDACDEPGLVTLTRDGALCAACTVDRLDDGPYVRECDRCYARETTDTEYPEHRAWLCDDCRYDCHDFDDQGD